MRVQDVAGKHRHAVAESPVEAHLVSPRVGVIDDVVVHE